MYLESQFLLPHFQRNHNQIFSEKEYEKRKKINCGKNKTSLVIKKLKKNRKYYVQIRTKAGKKYSAWSKVKTISKR